MFPPLFSSCPIDALPGLLYDAAYEIHALDDEIPAEALLTDAIATSVVAVQRCHDVRGLDARSMPTTVNTLALVPSGVGKGTSYSFFFKAHEAHAAEGRPSAGEPRVERGEANKAPRMQEDDGAILQQVSYRALMECLDGTNCNATIQHEDGWSFLKSDLVTKYIDKLTQVWSGIASLQHRVHGTNLVALGGRCSIGFRLQPKLFYPFLKQTGNASFHQGFWPRAIAACYDPVRFQTLPVRMRRPQGIGGQAALATRLGELLGEADDRRAEGALERKVVVLSHEAAAFMHELKFRMKQWRMTVYVDIEEAASRGWENTLRLAAVFHVVCVGEGEISLEMVERAWAIVAWSLGQQRLIFVKANQPLPKPALVKPTTVFKPSRHHRALNADMQFVLDAIGMRALQSPGGRVRMDEVLLLSGLHKTRFLKTMAWLVTAGFVVTECPGESEYVRLASSGWLGPAGTSL